MYYLMLWSGNNGFVRITNSSVNFICWALHAAQVCVVVSESVRIDTVSSITAQQCKLHACTYSLGNLHMCRILLNNTLSSILCYPRKEALHKENDQKERAGLTVAKMF